MFFCIKKAVLSAALMACIYTLPESWAQKADSVRTLHEVTVRGIPESKFAVGAAVWQPDSAIVSRLASASLSDLLMRQSAVYMREYGGGMMGTISMRGTGPSQTALLWNGINLNHPSLGLIDFSIIPLAAGSRLLVQPGSGSSLYGSDALGGTVHIRTDSEWQEGFQANLQQEFGSFGRYFTRLQAGGGSEKWQAQTGFYRLQQQNDFPFRNVAKAGVPTERQQNAAVHYWGLTPEIYFRPDNRRQLSLKTWYHDHFRQVQPTMAAQEVRDEQQDANLRLMADYEQLTGTHGVFRAKTAFIFDEIIFNGDRSATWRYWTQARHEQNWNNRLTTEIGGNVQHTRADVRAYRGDITELRTDWFALSRLQIHPNVLLSATIRQTIVPGFSAPIAPALGSQWQRKITDSQLLTWKLQASKGYRVPTLNDRFWQPGGNPDIRPERSYNAETSLGWQLHKGSNRLQINSTAFRMWVQDWILWLPRGSFWSPENAREVRVTGLEINGLYRRLITGGYWELRGHYALNQSLNLQPLSDNDRSAGKQLPYTPLHRAQASSAIVWKGWLLQADANYTGTRYPTADNETSLKPFWISNLLVSKDLQIKKIQAQALLRVNNLLNADYQNFQLRAMPGRHFQAGITIGSVR
ncbi:TonB-dependent receptor plug domain-containing protein [Rhodoflexus caldus]|uniref:TonB-dependent receptor plug domain-containing protein n=1 Tax=Rhodoflexus caldus TaxID=2891236 RepID=UPI00202A0D66|nr:TonB-dependent receptor plug domain-containing protein [Rhodoflexus caldus]